MKNCLAAVVLIIASLEFAGAQPNKQAPIADVPFVQTPLGTPATIGVITPVANAAVPPLIVPGPAIIMGEISAAAPAQAAPLSEGSGVVTGTPPSGGQSSTLEKDGSAFSQLKSESARFQNQETGEDDALKEKAISDDIALLKKSRERDLRYLAEREGSLSLKEWLRTRDRIGDFDKERKGLQVSLDRIRGLTAPPHDQRYKIRLTKRRDGDSTTWLAERDADRRMTAFRVAPVSPAISREHLWQAVHLYRVILDRDSWRLAEFMLNVPDKETLCLLWSDDKVVGLYRYIESSWDASSLLDVLVVDEDYRGTGAVDVLFEDITDRLASGDADRQFNVEIVRPGSRVRRGQARGTVQEIKRWLGVKSEVVLKP